MPLKIALVGNPNSGKTTMFNDLTGSVQYVGNWPGVTVEKKEGKLRSDSDDAVIVDLPGIYSLSPYTVEEVVTRDFLLNERPDAIINIVDASSLERNLYLTTQLLELGLPVIIALNMMDIIQKNGDRIDSKKLSDAFGCEVIETSALKGVGSEQVARAAITLAKQRAQMVIRHSFNDRIERAISEISSLIGDSVTKEQLRWFAIKLFERDKKVLENFKLSDTKKLRIDEIIAKCEADQDDDSESIIIAQRYGYIEKAVASFLIKKNKTGPSASDRIDRVVTNRILALPIFGLMMWGIYYIAITSIGSLATDFINDTLFGEIIIGNLHNWLVSVGAAAWLNSLIIEGIIGGVGAVLGFVPQIMILFLLISILEDLGYMARVAFIMDRIFRRFGLSGKSFIPMLIGFGCSVPAVMASRTIENDKDRKMTIMLTPFIPCSAKLPIFALITGVFFPAHAWVAPSMYFLGIFMVILSGLILKRTRLFKGETAPFVMELPAYHLPSMKNVFIHTWERVKAFIIKAGTIIFIGCGVIWFLKSFNLSLEMVDAGDSMLAAIGNLIAPIFAPLGFGNWQSSVAILTGMLAKENIVATFGVLFGIPDGAAGSTGLTTGFSGMFTFVSAYAFMVFTSLAAPCVSAISATKREMGGWRWTLIAITYQTGLAYVMALIVNQVGSAIFLDADKTPAIVIVAVILCAIIYLGISSYRRKNALKYSPVVGK